MHQDGAEQQAGTAAASALAPDRLDEESEASTPTSISTKRKSIRIAPV